MSSFLRLASWHEVTALFPTEADALRNAEGWAVRYGDVPREYRLCRVELQAWSDDALMGEARKLATELAAVMDEMSEFEPRMTADWVDGVNNAQLPPRVEGLPAVMVQFGERFGMIDGKHRANRWKRTPGLYAVLVVLC